MKKLIELLFRIGELKNVKRRGWVLRNISNPESVADHSFRTSIIALLLSDKLNLDKNKCVQMALIHDLCEIITGDTIPQDNIEKEEQWKKEREAISLLFKDLQDTEIIKLWDEYIERKTPEAQFIHEIDKIELLLQGLEYKKENQNLDLDVFFSSSKKEIKNKEVLAIIDILKNHSKKNK